MSDPPPSHHDVYSRARPLKDPFVLLLKMSFEKESVQDTEKKITSGEASISESSDDFILGHDQSEPYIDITVHLDDAERQRRSTWWFKTSMFFWDSMDKHPKEREFLFKLDFFLLTSCCTGYFIKQLNQTNVGTAYVNGMKEYYDMSGNDYNVMTTLWTVGYIIGQIPSNLILHRVSARYYLAGLEISWAILTLLCITPKSVNGMWALRFLIGLLESGYFPAVEYLLGSWYTKEEISKRSAFFGCSGFASGLVSGPLQQAILNSSFANKHLQPFQWMFVIDTIISAPIGVYTLFVSPNTPSTSKAFYFTEEDKLIALERRRREGAQLNTREPYTLNKIRSFFNTWHIWVFPIVFLCYQNAYQVNTSLVFQLWLKSDLKLSSYYYNTYPTIVTGVGIAFGMVGAYTNDFFGGQLNAHMLYLVFVMVIFGASINAVYDVSKGLHYAAYFIQAVPLLGLAQPMVFSWVNRLLHHDDMKRNFVVVVTNTITYVTSAWVPMFTFNQDDAPRFHKGFIFTACLGGLGIIMNTVAVWFTLRDKKRTAVVDDHGDAGDDKVEVV